MKKSMQSGLIAMLISFFGTSAQGGILLEPYLNYNTSSVSADVLAIPIGLKDKGSVSIGGRIGYKLILPIWIAADISQGSGTFSPDLNVTGNSSFTRSDAYATVGFDFPILFRAWVGLGLSSSLKIKDSAGTTTEYSGGSKQKLGVGLGFIPLLSVNVEYFTSKPNAPAGSTKAEETGLSIGVSAPFNL